MRPPTKTQLVGNEPLGLDHESVIEHFLGQTQEEVRKMIPGRMHYLAEDFMWMAPGGLAYYLPPVLDYLKSDQGQTDWDAAYGILCSLSTQIELSSPLPIEVVALSKEICAYIRQHSKRYGISPDEELFQKYVATITNA